MLHLAKPGPLQGLTDKVAFALEQCEIILPDCAFEGGLWYHTMALLNGYYALQEELIQSVKNTPDQVLSKAIDDWWTENKEASNAFFGDARRFATHLGDIHLSFHQEWERDAANDTEHPVGFARVNVPGTKVENFEGRELIAKAKEAFNFFDAGLAEIVRRYKENGGTAVLRLTVKEAAKAAGVRVD